MIRFESVILPLYVVTNNFWIVTANKQSQDRKTTNNYVHDRY